MSFNLLLSIIDIRILPLNKFDVTNENYLYFMDVLLGIVEMLYSEDENNSNDGVIQEIKIET